MHNSFSHPMGVAKLVVRVGFGLALMFVGIAHYQDASSFAEAVGRGLGALEGVGMVWGYVLPGLMIVGGALLTLGLFPSVGALLAGVALASIPAGLMLKSVLSGISLDDTMPPAMNAFVWLLAYVAAVRGLQCQGGCACCTPEAPQKSMPVKMTIPVKPAVAAKATAKKTAGKKK